jgi:two-component system chemotaxis response regulator CheY
MKCKILVVDDSSLSRRMTRKILDDLGHEVEEASDGAQALELFVLNRHDFVVLDMVMHGMYGLEVLAKLRELDPSLRVIVLTADIQQSTRQQVKEAGAAAMVNKPVSKEALAEVLETIQAGGTGWN